MVEGSVSEGAPYVGDTSRSPIIACTVSSIVSAFLSIGILASYLPQSPPLVWPIAFLVLSSILWVVGLFLLSRLQHFAWSLFFAVARWVFLLTLVFAGMAIYIFLTDGTRGASLAIMVVVLILAAVNIPMLLGFSVARHERIEPLHGGAQPR